MDQFKLDNLLAGAALQIMEAFFMSNQRYVVLLRSGKKIAGFGLFTLDGDDGFPEINPNYGLVEKYELQKGLEEQIFSSNDVMAIEDLESGKTVFDRRAFV